MPRGNISRNKGYESAVSYRLYRAPCVVIFEPIGADRRMSPWSDTSITKNQIVSRIHLLYPIVASFSSVSIVDGVPSISKSRDAFTIASRASHLTAASCFQHTRSKTRQMRVGFRAQFSRQPLSGAPSSGKFSPRVRGTAAHPVLTVPAPRIGDESSLSKRPV